MGWGIDFKADIFLSKQNYNENVHEVQEQIDELEEKNMYIEKRLISLISMSPEHIQHSPDEDLNQVIINDVEDLLIWKAENDVAIYQLGLYTAYLRD
jgi:hypothetical protein